MYVLLLDNLHKITHVGIKKMAIETLRYQHWCQRSQQIIHLNMILSLLKKSVTPLCYWIAEDCLAHQLTLGFHRAAPYERAAGFFVQHLCWVNFNVLLLFVVHTWSLEFCVMHYDSKYMRGETLTFGLDTHIHAPPVTTLLLLRRVFWLVIMLLSMRSESIPSSVLDRDGREPPSLPSAGGVNCLERLREKTCDLPCAVSTRDMISTCWSWTPDRGLLGRGATIVLPSLTASTRTP